MHDCIKTRHIQYIEKTWLRKYGLNITTGKYKVVCYSRKYESEETYTIEVAGDARFLHIRDKGCPEDMVKIRPIEEATDEAEWNRQNSETEYEWMYECLEEAKNIILNYHSVDGKEFLSRYKFNLFIQTDKEHAYGYINLDNYPYFNIGIHKILTKDTPDNRRMVRVVLVHELLHVIHPDWSEAQIQYNEELLMNKAGHFDALRNLEILYLSGKMRLCDR